MNSMTLPLVLSGAATAAAASIVHFTPGPLPQNRLIAFTGLVAFAALALLVSAWRAGVALVGWCRGAKPRVVEVARAPQNPPSHAHASGETTPALRRTTATSVTPGGILPATQDLVKVFQAVAMQYGIGMEFAPKNFVKQGNPLTFTLERDEAVVMGEIQDGTQKVRVVGKGIDQPLVGHKKDLDEAALISLFMAAISSYAPEQSKTLTFFIPNRLSVQLPKADQKKIIRFVLKVLEESAVKSRFPTRRIFLEQPTE